MGVKEPTSPIGRKPNPPPAPPRKLRCGGQHAYPDKSDECRQTIAEVGPAGDVVIKCRRCGKRHKLTELLAGCPG